jgi:AP-5 complex subunit mu-1
VTQRGKQEIYFHIQEFISAVQYDNPALADVSQLTGGIICQAELDGTPELSVTLDKRVNQVLASQSLDQICTTLAPHHSVTNADYTSSYKLSCTPPSMSFELCKYYVRSLDKLPLRGFYQMKEAVDGEVQILVQLKLNEEVNNEFEYCELEIPFPNKGKIASIDSTPTAGTVTVHPERKNSLLWNIGTKFTHRNLEVALPASVYFEAGDGVIRDPFLAQNNNSYVALNFRILNWTASGVNIERKNISIFPKPSNKLYIIDRSVTSEDYKIWNSLGQALHCLPSLEHSDEHT